MKGTTNWQPDTCECILDFDWDDKDGSVAVNKIIKVCKAHAEEKDIVEHFQAVLEENQRKNIAIGKIMSEVSRAVDTTIDEKGDSVQKLKPGFEVAFSFDAERKLILNLDSLTTQEKATVITACDSALGTGKVEFGAKPTAEIGK
jgi:hypothetical protein